MTMKSTKQVAEILGIGVARHSQAVWAGRVPQPEKGPGNSYCWTDEDIDKASRALLGKPYHPAEKVPA